MTQAPEALPPADRRSAFANAPMGVALCGTDGSLIDVNGFLGGFMGLLRRVLGFGLRGSTRLQQFLLRADRLVHRGKFSLALRQCPLRRIAHAG